jgi:four helix bundle protein
MFFRNNCSVRESPYIGTNIREAYNGESDADFIHKFSISQKEYAESAYGLELLYETQFLSENEFTSIYNNCIELLKIISGTPPESIILTKKQNIKHTS